MPDDAPIYLDHNATTPLLPEVVDAMIPFLRDHFGNPSSGHAYGQHTKHAVETARGHVATLLGCDADEVVFTSGGTEANNLAIRGTTAARTGRRSVVTSVIEHPATARPCDWLEANGHCVSHAGVDAAGRVELDEVRNALNEEVVLVTLMHSNNETGTLQPIAEIAKEARAFGALVHTDAAQSVGKVPVDVATLGVDLLSLAGHKLYAPKGVGALYVKRGTTLEPLVRGAGHERGIRPGTENVASIVGLGVACAAARRDLITESARVATLRDRLHERLRAGVPGLELNGHPVARLPNTLNVRFPDVSGPALLAQAPVVAASTGSACHEGEDQASPVILAMGVGPVAAFGSVRLSLGRSTTPHDVDRAAEALTRAWTHLRRSNNVTRF